MQFALFRDNSTSKTIINVSIKKLVLSRFNPRRVRGKDEVEKLATRIQRNGFEITRALWAYQAGDTYEVFAGGTRLEAARLAGIDIVPIVLHEGFDDDAIARLADEDNENDEYHTPVSIVDVWADYARLQKEEGWNQERIARAKRTDKGTVSRRLKFHALPEHVKRLVGTGVLTEGHLKELLEGVGTFQLSPWLTPEEALAELAAKVAHDKGKSGEKSVRATREDVATWKAFIAYAEQTHSNLPDAITLYKMGDPPTPYILNAREAFVAELAKSNARSLPKVKAAERAIRTLIADNLAAYQRWVETQSTAAALEAEKAEKEQRLLSKFVHGDGVAMLRAWQGEPIRLLLTDPPYGIAYQSNRRWKTAAPAKLQGDTEGEAMALLRAGIEAATPHLADEAHVLVFCDWEGEPEVRDILVGAGLKLKGSLVWVKEEHSAGDVHGAFAPRHERIVHAVKGSPKVTPRIPDVLEVARSHETNHPTEKPVQLLRRLIESTTNEGDMVADPFAGQASTLIAAYRTNREFWGAEVDEAHHEKGTTRLLREGGLNA